TLAVDWRDELVGDPETGAFMGGVVTTLLDHATGLSLLTRMDDTGRPGGTMDLRIDYLKPSTRGEPLQVEGQCYRVTRHVAFVRGRAYHPARPGHSTEDTIAHAAGTYSVDRSSSTVEIGEVPVIKLLGKPALPLAEPFPDLVRRARDTRDLNLIARTIPYF